MLSQKITIINKLGLHARASMQLIDRANRYQSSIHIRYNNHEIDAKDIMNVMALAVSKGAIIELIVSGPDEQQAMEDIVALIQKRFGEE